MTDFCQSHCSVCEVLGKRCGVANQAKERHIHSGRCWKPWSQPKFSYVKIFLPWNNSTLMQVTWKDKDGIKRDKTTLKGGEKKMTLLQWYSNVSPVASMTEVKVPPYHFEMVAHHDPSAGIGVTQWGWEAVQEEAGRWWIYFFGSISSPQTTTAGIYTPRNSTTSFVPVIALE